MPGSAEPTNAEVARAFQLMADLLRIDGADRHRIAAYERGAARVRSADASVARMALAGRAVELPDIGATLQAKIAELATTGRIAALDALTERLPAGLAEIARLEGIGPKRARAIWDALGIADLADLAAAAADGRLATVPGFGVGLVASVAEQAAAGPPAERRWPLAVALPLARALVEDLRRVPRAERVEIAGSIRRGRDTIGDVDLVAASDDPAALLDTLAAHRLTARVLERGAAGIGVETQSGMRVELAVGPASAFGNLLQHATGSAAHNIRLRARAVKAGRSVSQHGIAGPGGEVDTHREEAGVYAALGLPMAPPELREDLGELDGPLPEPVRIEDLRGDLHAHSDWSDGRATIERMAEAAAARGYAYLAITDHSRGLAMVGGLDPERARRQWERIDALNASGAAGVRVLKGVELEILADGRLDLDDDVLAGFDVVVASIHSGFRQRPAEVTARLLHAVESPHVDVIGHPTGRRIGRRDPLAFDVDRVLERAAAAGTLLEINGQGERLDLPDHLARRAREAGCRFALSSDAHAPEGLAGIALAVTVARRAGITADLVANAAPAWPPG